MAAAATTSPAPSCCAAASPRPGAGCPRSSRACRCPPGTGLDRRSSSPAAPGSRSRSTAARRSCRARSRRGSRRQPRPGPQRVLVSRLPRRRRRLALDAVPGRRPAVPQAAPAARARRVGRRCPSPRTPRSAGIRRSRRSRRCTARARSPSCPGVGYDRPEPVALHLAPLLGGRRDDEQLAHRLARPLPRPRRARRQPAAGPLARRRASSRRSRRRECRSPRSTGPTASTSGRGTSGATSRTGCSTRSARSARSRTGGDPALAQATRGRAPVGQPATAAAPVPAEGGAAGFAQPGRLPAARTTRSRAACRPRRDARRRAAAPRASR